MARVRQRHSPLLHSLATLFLVLWPPHGYGIAGDDQRTSRQDVAIQQQVMNDGWLITCRRAKDRFPFEGLARFDEPPYDAILRLRGLDGLKWLHLYVEVSDDHIEGIGELKELHRLSLYGGGHASGISGRGLKQLARLTSLRSLFLDSVPLRDAAFLDAMRDLHALSLRWISLREEDLRRIGGLSKLRTLELIGFRPITTEGFKQITRLSLLDTLWLGYPGLSDSDIAQLSQAKNLRTLTVDAIDLNARGIREVRSLEELCLIRPRIAPEAIDAIADLDRLRVLTIASRDPEDELDQLPVGCPPLSWPATRKGVCEMPDLSALRRSKSLRSLTIIGAHDLKGIEKAGSLEELTLRDLSLGATEFERISSLNAVTSMELDVRLSDGLDLSGMGSLPDLRTLRITWGIRDSDAAALARQFPRLEVLDAPRSKMRPEALSVLRELPELRVLGLANSGSMNDEHLKQISQVPTLEELDLAGTAVSDSGLASLVQLPKLRRLSLAGVRAVSDSGLQNVRPIASLEEIDLSGTCVTDKGLDALRSFPRLRVLDLGSNDAITDKSIEVLARIPTLERIDLTSTKVSSQGIRGLSSLPKLQSVYAKMDKPEKTPATNGT